MLQILIIIYSLLSLVTSQPIIDNDNRNAQVLRYEMETGNMPNSYKFYYDTSDGSSRTEEGSILNPGTNNAALDVLGTVRWYDEKGGLYEMTYKAGKRGYRTTIKKIS